VSFLQLLNNVIECDIGSRQEYPEHFDHIVTGKQREIFPVFSTDLQHKEHRQHHHSHVMVLALPLAKLVTGHPNFALGVAQSVLDPVPLALH
jgi:hypothetical protein